MDLGEDTGTELDEGAEDEAETLEADSELSVTLALSLALDGPADDEADEGVYEPAGGLVGMVDDALVVEVIIPELAETEADADAGMLTPDTLDGLVPSARTPLPHGTASPFGCVENSGGVVWIDRRWSAA